MFHRLKPVAQLIGFMVMALLTLYGGLTLLRGEGLVQAAVRGEPGALKSSSQSGLQNTLLAQGETVPNTMNYQGTLRDLDGSLLSGVYTLTFRIYDHETGANILWTETHTSVTVRDGVFSVLLGDDTALGVSLFNEPDRYIGVTIEPYDELIPRQRFVSVPYAIQAEHSKNATNAQHARSAQHATNAESATNAENADLLDGLNSTVFARATLTNVIVSSLDAPDGSPARALYLDNDGRTHINDLTVNGNITNFGVSNIFSVESHSSDVTVGGIQTETLTPKGKSFCFLTKVEVEDLHVNGNKSFCEIRETASHWELAAFSNKPGADGSDTVCEARCFDWD